MFACSPVTCDGTPGVVYRLPKRTSVLIFTERPDGLMCCVKCSEIWHNNPQGMLHYRQVNSLHFAFDPAKRHLPACSPFSRRVAERLLGQKIPANPLTPAANSPKFPEDAKVPQLRGTPRRPRQSFETPDSSSSSRIRARKRNSPEEKPTDVPKKKYCKKESKKKEGHAKQSSIFTPDSTHSVPNLFHASSSTHKSSRKQSAPKKVEQPDDFDLKWEEALRAVEEERKQAEAANVLRIEEVQSWDDELPDEEAEHCYSVDDSVIDDGTERLSDLDDEEWSRLHASFQFGVPRTEFDWEQVGREVGLPAPLCRSAIRTIYRRIKEQTHNSRREKYFRPRH